MFAVWFILKTGWGWTTNHCLIARKSLIGKVYLDFIPFLTKHRVVLINVSAVVGVHVWGEGGSAQKALSYKFNKGSPTWSRTCTQAKWLKVPRIAVISIEAASIHVGGVSKAKEYMKTASVWPKSSGGTASGRRCSCAPSASRALMEANKCGRTPKDSSMCTWPDGNVYVGEIHNTARCTARESFLGRASCRLGTPT